VINIALCSITRFIRYAVISHCCATLGSLQYSWEAAKSHASFVTVIYISFATFWVQIVMQIYVFGLGSPSLFSVIYAAAAVHLCVSCMFISFISEKLFMCTVTTLMTCAISFLLSLQCNLQICGKSSLISTVSLTRPPSLSTSKSLSFRNISSKSYKPLMSNRSVSFRLQDSSAFEI
jgi:hypothetical protein